MEQIKEKLEYIRGELRAETISYGEIAELQELIPYIEKGDTELLEAAGVPEQGEKTMTITKTIEATKCFYVTHSPRGFANELSVAVFATKKEADEFRDEVDNNVNRWTVPASSLSHRREVDAYKAETAHHFTSDTPLTRYQARGIDKF